MSVSKAPAFKAALVAALQAQLPSGTLVTYGHPGSAVAPDMVAVMDVTSDQEVAAMGSGRPRWETLTATVMFSVFRGGVDQQTVTERAYTLLGILETYLQDAGNIPSTQITLGGAVLQSRVTGHELVESSDPDELALGRLAEITATVTALVRI